MTFLGVPPVHGRSQMDFAVHACHCMMEFKWNVVRDMLSFLVRYSAH
jgi:hypothetical protein